MAQNIFLKGRPLDALDVQILQLLQTNARLTNREVALQLGLSVTPTYERIRRLERLGYIRGYVALLDPQRIGQGLAVMATIRLKEHSREYLEQFVEQIQKLPEVMECYYVAGAFDYILKVAVPDMEAYQQFLVKKLAGLENIGQVQSHFIMTDIKKSTAYPLNAII
jgi:Lrp/AsnC family transcriptional regulator, leucine-responsive regulatory protein